MTQKTSAMFRAPGFNHTERRGPPLRLIRTSSFRVPFQADEPTLRVSRSSGSASRVPEAPAPCDEEQRTGRFMALRYQLEAPTLRVARIADLPARGEGISHQGERGRALQLQKPAPQKRAQLKGPPEPKLRYLQTVELRARSTTSRLPGPQGGHEERILAPEGGEYHEDQFTMIYHFGARQFTHLWADHSGEASRRRRRVSTMIVNQGPRGGWGGRALRVILITLITVALGCMSVNLPLALACMVMAALLLRGERGGRRLQRSLRARRGRQVLEFYGGYFNPEERQAVQVQFSR